MDFRDKKVVVVGLARSGAGAANLLSSLGAVVTVTDRKGKDELSGAVSALSPSVKLSLGGHPDQLFEDADLVVISPGVPSDIPPLKKAAEKGTKIIGELELAYQTINSKCPAFLAVTGTNGKSTVTTLLYEMLKNGGLNAVIGGNIGEALTEVLFDAHSGTPIPRHTYADYIVAEVSSFQLETIDEFRPKGAAILNITPDHMDRYRSLSEYTDAKCRVFINQKEGDFLVLNADDPMTLEVMKRGKRLWGAGNAPDIFYFSRQNEVKGAYLKDGVVHVDVPGLSSGLRLAVSDLLIKGVHNVENAMAASLMALLSGCSTGAVAATLQSFPGLEHRLEFVRELDGVRYINDSKGTNLGAVIKSLEGFEEPVLLIAGGRDKAGDFSVLKPFIKERVKALILIGEAAGKIKDAVGDSSETFMESDLAAAVSRARQKASAGDVVLLSPACASFDMFRDFEDRGRQFKRLVMEL